MKKREFLKSTASIAIGALLPASAWAGEAKKKRLRTAHIGVGGMGMEDDIVTIRIDVLDIIGVFRI